VPNRVLVDNSQRARAGSMAAAVDACDIAADTAAEVMVSRCPVGVGGGYGGLHMWQTIERSREEETERPYGAESSVRVGDPERGVDYTPYVVFGTRYMSPQDFVGPGFEAGRKAFERAAGAGG
jgi:hypothetical protein